MTAEHEQLIAHEAGHAVGGMLAGLCPHQVTAPPLPDREYARANPTAKAGVCSFYRTRDRRALGLATLAGMLASGDPVPGWPLDRPRTDDERTLAAAFAEQDELVFAEAVADAKQLVESKRFVRLHRLVGELLSHPPHRLTGDQLMDIKAAVNVERATFPTEVKILNPVDEPDADRDELGVISDAQVELDLAAMDATSNSGAPAKTLSKRAQAEWKAIAAALDGNGRLDEAEQQLRDALLDASRPPIEITTFEA
jgi:hypothetical protein